MSGRNSEAGETAESGVSGRRKPARDRIFETAREMFYARGIRAVGVESIAAEAGTTKMSLYRNFPSKDELVAECLRDESRQSWEWWDEIAAPHAGAPRAQLEALFDGFANKTCDQVYGCGLSNAAIELHEPDHPARAVALEHKRGVHARLVELTKAAGAQDEELADSLMMLLEGAYVARVTMPTDLPRRSLASAARVLISAYLDRR
jgi:AcrR family transcriptional regulator